MIEPLKPEGVAMLLVYGARLMPPREGKPGIRVTVEEDGACILQAVGYPDQPAAQTAIARAHQTCVDANLDVYVIGPVEGLPARRVRRKHRDA